MATQHQDPPTSPTTTTSTRPCSAGPRRPARRATTTSTSTTRPSTRSRSIEAKAAAVTKLPLVTQLVDTHVTLTREVAGVYVTAARDLLKA